MADGSRLSYCEITGIVRRTGQQMVLGQIKRRDFITLLGGAAAAWPLAARAEVDRVRRIGILMGIPETDREAKIWVSAFQKGLQEAGWIESRNIRSEQYERMQRNW